jgi:hypothetical protein
MTQQDSKHSHSAAENLPESAPETDREETPVGKPGPQ